ncbi:hypothetical protein [Ruegeria lacuscaerulensis]|uniref:hypothetical protein n=1 Tax=Ruegeria lacuscaerulensis TaxID=55218 RepID=UPI00147A4DA4|nr:hypothetical protein [Ruegeria lacuscaerulensis]
MTEPLCTLYVPVRVLALYEAIEALKKPDTEDHVRKSAEIVAHNATEDEHYDAWCYMHLHENQDLMGPVRTIAIDDPAVKRMETVYSSEVI